LLPSRWAYGQSVGESLAKFVDPLPILPVVKSSGSFHGDPLYVATMRQFRQKLHRDLPATTVWGFNGQYPGPTFEARRGRPIAVRWVNDLTPTRHPLPVDHTLHGAETTPEVRTVVHLHGHKVLPESDGYPEAWFTRGFARKGPFWTNEVYHYPNDQAATTLWYHDHTLGALRLNMSWDCRGSISSATTSRTASTCRAGRSRSR
jgi:spore coat protein A